MFRETDQNRPRSGDPVTLLEESMRLTSDALAAQAAAKLAIEQQPPAPADVVSVVPGGPSLPSVLESCAAGATIVVDPAVVTVGDVIVPKPVHLLGAAIQGLVDVQAPDVYLLGCTVTGQSPDGALVATADRLTMQACCLTGSLNGQHRGVWVRSKDVRILDSSILNIWKSGQETQAVAGWSGVKDLLVERCLLEAAGVNVHIGGTDPASEADIPERVTVRHCYLRKLQQWWGWTGAKNLFEIKNCKGVVLEQCRLEFSWVEGQTGYAILLNVRNQEGGAPYSTIEDVVIRRNSIQWTAGGLNLLGRDYTHPSQVMKRVLIEGNTFENIEPRWGSNQRCVLLAHGGEDVTLRGNQFSGSEINSFLTFEAEPWTRLCVEDNVFPEGYYGIKSDDCALGTPTLEKYAPGCAWGSNTVQRSIPTNSIPYPPGTTIVPV